MNTDVRPFDAIERLLGPTVTAFGRVVSTFQVCGLVGFALATASAIALAVLLRLSPVVFGLLAVAAAAEFLALALVTRAVLGEERLVYYHHEATVLVASGALLAAFRQPVLAYLDVVCLALGVFLVCGRVGCFSVGCCHGRPHRLGLRYGPQHAEAGFSRALVGVPLLPVQPVESLMVLALTVVGAMRLAARAEPGATLATQLVSYTVARLVLEVGRGDAARPQWGGLSEAQWSSVAIALGVVAAERAGLLPRSSWHGPAVACVALGAGALVVRSRWHRALRRLLSPRHVEELAAALVDLASIARPPRVRVLTTSLGVRISSSGLPDCGEEGHIYTLSGVDARGARALASLIRLLRPRSGSDELLERASDVFHLIIRPHPQARKA